MGLVPKKAEGPPNQSPQLCPPGSWTFPDAAGWESPRAHPTPVGTPVPSHLSGLR